MKSFLEFVNLTEALITFDNKAYPKFGNIVILAGGAGSGKGFIIKTLLGIEGKTFNVDATKLAAMDTKKLSSRIKKETNIDITKLNLKNPSDVMTLHSVLKDTIDKKDDSFVTAVANTKDKSRLPNVIFDVTLKDWKKLDEISRLAEAMGYEKRNIHIVWVINSITVARKQNTSRARVVPDEILVKTHIGAANTFKDIMNEGEKISKTIDGDIWLVFNNVENGDVKLKTSGNRSKYTKSPAGTVDKVEKIKIKKSGKRGIFRKPQEILDKLFDYTHTKF
jgi:hypothetical protein